MKKQGLREAIDSQTISEFKGEYRFLSNFYMPPGRVLHFSGLTFKTVEHAYQAMKMTNAEDVAEVAGASTPGEAKRIARRKPIVEHWDRIKFRLMVQLVTIKFSDDDWLAKQLLATGDRPIVEGNKWGDTYWGVCNGRGKNMLGKILMMVRETLRLEQMDALKLEEESQ